MGTIKADTVTGLADPNKLTVPTTVTVGATILTDGSAGSTTVTGEGGSTTTNLQQGLCKCWIQFNGTGTISTQDSFNRGGLTDNGTGDYTITYTNNMANDDYAASGMGNAAQMAINDSITTSTIRILVSNSGGTDSDVTIVTVTTHGDLA